MMSESEKCFKIPTLDKTPCKHLRHIREKYASVERRLRADEPQPAEEAVNPNPNLPTLDKDHDQHSREICGFEVQRLSVVEPQPAEKAVQTEQHHYLPTLDKDPLKHETPQESELSKKFHQLKILEEIGHGVFGKVYRVEDTQTSDRKKESALKIIKNTVYYTTELEILKLLKQLEGDRYHCIPLLHSYHTKDETMFQFPLYEVTIDKFMRSYSPNGLPIPEVYKLMKQICTGLAFLHRNGIFHSDLKTDNVMFLPSDKVSGYDNEGRMQYTKMADPKIMLIDFGHARMMRPNNPTTYTYKVCCMTYRPAECHLKMSVGYPVDVWCAGLICFYLYRGHELFKNGTKLEMLAQIEKVIEKFPERLTQMEEGRRWFAFGYLKKPSYSTKNYSYEKLSKAHNIYSYKKSRTGNSHSLFELMQGLLQIDPKERTTMEEVIKKENW